VFAIDDYGMVPIIALAKRRPQMKANSGSSKRALPARSGEAIGRIRLRFGARGNEPEKEASRRLRRVDPCRNIPFAGVADPFAALTHLVGFVVSGASSVPLWRAAQGNARLRTNTIVFVASMLLLFAASTAYHVAGS